MKALLLRISFLICCWLPVTQAATPLPSAQAFQLQAEVSGKQAISLHWQLAPGYYLYAEKFRFESSPSQQITSVIPQGDFKYDAENGRQEVLTGHFVIPLSLQDDVPFTLSVHYQGCSQDGFCYPPSQKQYVVDFTKQTMQEVTNDTSLNVMQSLFDQEKIKHILKTQHQGMVLLLFFAFGLLLAFTPCVLPMLPIMSSIIMGNEGRRRGMHALCLSFLYVLGASIAYALLGLLAASAGQSLQFMLQQPIVISVVCVLFLLLAAINFGWFAIIFPRVWQKAVLALNHRIDGGSLTGVFFMGVVSTLIISPCITAPLIGVLLYIAETGNKLLGASALFVMGMGLGLPLILAGTSFNYLLPRSGPWLIAVKHVFGFVMLLMAIWLASRVLSSPVIYGASVLLLFLFACYVAFWLPHYIKRQGHCLILGAVIGSIGFYVMADRAPTWLAQKSSMQFASSFTRVTTLAALDAALLSAKKEQVPVLVDFYADWCASCLVMEKDVLNAPEVVLALKKVRLLRVDLTQNTADDQAIMRRFNVIAPPTFLLFNRSGVELPEQRIVGEVDVPFFLSRLKAID